MRERQGTVDMMAGWGQLRVRVTGRFLVKYEDQDGNQETFESSCIVFVNPAMPVDEMPMDDLSVWRVWKKTAKRTFNMVDSRRRRSSGCDHSLSAAGRKHKRKGMGRMKFWDLIKIGCSNLWRRNLEHF